MKMRRSGPAAELAKISGLAASADFIELGRALRPMRDREQQRFKSICQDGPVRYRRAMHFIEIAQGIDKRLLTELEARELGWTKALIVLHHATTRAEARKLLEQARRLSAAALRDTLVSGRSAARLTVSFLLTQSEAEHLSQALLQAGARHGRRGLDGRSEALMKIVRAFAPTSTRGRRGT